ncbi:MAG: universal stress protein [Saprospirales bacterium]|nr:MAG: universal stress protein [Saprospirales bacterium]
MKKILCPLDFSVTSINALQAACVIGEKYQVDEIQLITVHGEKVTSGAYSNEFFQLLSTANFDKALEKAISLARKKTGYSRSFTFKSINSKKRVSSLINQTAKEGQFDLICMGTEGQNTLRKVVFGSTTQKVLEESTIHVLAVPKNWTAESPEKIALGVDFLYFDQRRFEEIHELISVLSPNIHLFDVNIANNPLMEDKMAEIKNKLAHYPGLKFSLVNAIDVVSGILKFTDLNPTDLIVLLSKNYKLIDRLFERSYTEKLVLHTQIPVLALKFN